jgi:hypothetical protein
MSLSIIEGTWEEIERHKAELIGRRLRVTIQPERVMENTPAQSSTAPALSRIAPTRPFSALGKYAFVAGGSKEFAQEKQAEIEREDRTHG